MRILLVDNHPVGKEEIKTLFTEMFSGAENINDTLTEEDRKIVIERVVSRCFPDRQNTISSRDFAAFYKEFFPIRKSSLSMKNIFRNKVMTFPSKRSGMLHRRAESC